METKTTDTTDLHAASNTLILIVETKKDIAEQIASLQGATDSLIISMNPKNRFYSHYNTQLVLKNIRTIQSNLEILNYRLSCLLDDQKAGR